MIFLPYTVYGVQADEKSFSPIGFNGEYYDPCSGCYPLGLGYRLYSPSLMRFLSPDTLSPFGKGGEHIYGYCKNDPVNHVDRTGHLSTPPGNAGSPKPSKIARLSPPSWSPSPKSPSSSRSATSLDTAGRLSGYISKEFNLSLNFLDNLPPSSLSWPDFFKAKGMLNPRQIFDESKRLATSISVDPIVSDPTFFRTRLVIYMTTAGNSRDPMSALRSVYRNIMDIEVGETATYAENIRNNYGIRT